MVSPALHHRSLTYREMGSPMLIPFCCTLFEQLHSLREVLENTLAVGVEKPKIYHGSCVTRASSLFVPLDSQLIALRDT